MAKIKINDLQMSEELDKQALAKIGGGSRSRVYAETSDDSAWSSIRRQNESRFKILSAKPISRKMK